MNEAGARNADAVAMGLCSNGSCGKRASEALGFFEDSRVV
jgi:hypothetical protein